MMFIITLLLSPFEEAWKTLRSNEKEKEKEKKLFCQASLTLYVDVLKFLDEIIHQEIADNAVHFKHQTHDNSHDQTEFSNVMTAISQRLDCLTRRLNRLGRYIFDNYTFTQHVRSKTSSLPTPDQPINRL